MSPEEESRQLLHGIAHKVGATHDGLIRVEENIQTLSDRVTSLDKNLDIVRNHQQQQGGKIGIIVSENLRRDKAISSFQKKIDTLKSNITNVEHTGKMLVIKTSQTWKVVAVAATVFVGVAGLAIGILKVVF